MRQIKSEIDSKNYFELMKQQEIMIYHIKLNLFALFIFYPIAIGSIYVLCI